MSKQKHDQTPRAGVEQERELTAEEQRIRALAAKEGVTPAAAAELLRRDAPQ